MSLNLTTLLHYLIYLLLLTNTNQLMPTGTLRCCVSHEK